MGSYSEKRVWTAELVVRVTPDNDDQTAYALYILIFFGFLWTKIKNNSANLFSLFDKKLLLYYYYIKDVQSKEAFSPQKRTFSTSKGEVY